MRTGSEETKSRTRQACLPEPENTTQASSASKNVPRLQNSSSRMPQRPRLAVGRNSITYAKPMLDPPRHTPVRPRSTTRPAKLGTKALMAPSAKVLAASTLSAARRPNRSASTPHEYDPIIMPRKTTVVSKASDSGEMSNSQRMLGPKNESSIISIASTVSSRPATLMMRHWKRPNPAMLRQSSISSSPQDASEAIEDMECRRSPPCWRASAAA
mmetsp:Transcript_21314/g.67906  ORF Transcript_21314/g.67906 Transcript_21314/m.67906 type:complete len:214 (+) Transcript_21314:93-734(+)